MRPTITGSVLLLAVAAMALWAVTVLSPWPSATAAGTITFVGIDTDTTGNTASAINGHAAGSVVLATDVQNCITVSNGATITIDVVMDGLPADPAPTTPGDKLAGVEYDIDYNPAVIQLGNDDDNDGVFDEDTQMTDGDEDNDGNSGEEGFDDPLSVGATIGHDPSFVLSGPTDFSKGNGWDTASWSDFSVTFFKLSGFPSGPRSGVLNRITVTTVGAGVSYLNLSHFYGTGDPNSPPWLLDGTGAAFTIGNGSGGDAMIAVDEPCPETPPTPVPTPTPSPTPVPTPTPPATPTPTPGPTLGPTPTPRPPGGPATFNPVGTACLDNETTASQCDGNSAPGAVSGIKTTFNLPEGDMDFSAVINFIPPEWFVAGGVDIPDGALVGKLTAGATLGLLGGACNSQLMPVFNLMDATVDPSSQVTFDGGFDDANADGLPDAVTRYPDFLARMFPGQTLKARVYGQADVSGVDVSLNFLIFDPGTSIGGIAPDPLLGYPSVVILQNIGDPEIKPKPNAITDFCSPLATDLFTYGTTQDNPNTAANEGGVAYRSNPATAGTYNLVTYAASQRDADGDGLENTLDTCPFHPGTFDPRVGQWGTPQAGDKDGDRIADECDQSDDSTVGPGADVDRDSYLNAGDNCPQVRNGITSDGKTILGPNNQLDTDEDGIGDECDVLGEGGIGKGPNVPDGAVLTRCMINAVQVGTGGGSPPNPSNLSPCDGPVPTPTPTATPAPTPGPSPTPPAGFDAAVAAGSAAAPPNSQVTVGLTVTPAPGIMVGVVVVDVVYDDTLLTAVGCQVTPAGGVGACDPAVGPTTVRFAVADIYGISGSIGTITFNTLSTEITTPLTVAIQTCANPSGDPLVCFPQNGAITIAAQTPTPTPAPTPTPTPTPTPAPIGPANDNFQNAIAIPELLPYTNLQTTFGATTQPGEPYASCAGIDSSVWYRYTPATSTRLQASTAMSGYDTQLVVYAGTSLGSLTEVGCNDESATSITSMVTFEASAGQTYYFLIDGFGGATGNLVFSLDVAPPPLAIDVTIASVGAVAAKTGAVSVSGTMTCNKPSSVDLDGELRQRAGRAIIHGHFSAFVACTGQTRWTASLSGENGMFVGGQADISVTAFAFTMDEIARDDASASLQLKGSRPVSRECPRDGNLGFEAGQADTNVIPCWTVVDQEGGYGSWCNQTDTQLPQGPCSGNVTPVPAPPEGALAAMTNQSFVGSHLLYRCGVLRSGPISFQLYINNVAGSFFSPPSLDYNAGSNQQFRADLVTAAGIASNPFTVAPSDVLLNLYQTSPGDPPVSGYATITASASAFVRTYVCLRFAVVDNVFYFHAGVDDVKIDLR